MLIRSTCFLFLLVGVCEKRGWGVCPCEGWLTVYYIDWAEGFWESVLTSQKSYLSDWKKKMASLFVWLDESWQLTVCCACSAHGLMRGSVVLINMNDTCWQRWSWTFFKLRQGRIIPMGQNMEANAAGVEILSSPGSWKQHDYRK